MEQALDHWKKCSSCKKPIGFKQKYYVCSVSTCNGLRTGFVFCTMECWENHLPGARHRDAGAVSMESPAGPTAAPVGVRRIVTGGPATASMTSPKPQIPKEILIVASKLKDYIRARSEMNTSASVMDTLSDFVRQKCDDAIDKARQEGRKTVLDRDFE
jgi:hypothetical protein